MANFDFSVRQVAREALPRLIDNLVFPNLIYRDTAGNQPAKQGDTVSVRCPVRLTASDFDESSGVTPTSMQKDTVEVKLENIATVDMQVGAVEAACDFDSVVRLFIEPAAAALAEKINAEGLALYQDIPYAAGTAGTTPSDLSDLAAAGYALDMQKCPAGGRFAVWSPDATYNFKQVPAIVNADKCGSSAALRTGSIGRIFGIENYMSQAVKSHVSSLTGTLTVSQNATDSNTVKLGLSGTGAAGNIKKGDLLVIDGKYYTATKDDTAVSTTHTVQIYPKITVTSGTTATYVGAHKANLVFHPNAFAFVTRPLQAPAGVESYVTTYNGISLRVVRGYDMKYKREMLSMDVLYAFKTIYPELAVRYLG